MAASTPAGCLDIAIPFQRHFTRFADGCQISRVIERTEVMDTVKPAIVRIGVALHTVIVVQQGPLRDEQASWRAHLGRLKVGNAILRSNLIPAARILRLQNDHRHHNGTDHSQVADPNPPFDTGTRQSV